MKPDCNKSGLLLIVTLSLIISSCTSIKVPGYNSGITAVLVPKEYEILGEIVIEGSERSILGIINWGGATYLELLNRAKEEYQAEDVINISLDQRLSVFLGIYTSRKYMVRGLAIRYVNPEAD